MCYLVLLQGDQLIATSGVTYSTEEEYGEVKVKKGQKVVRVNAIGQVSGWCTVARNSQCLGCHRTDMLHSQ
jgi:pyrroloquinoline quinone (PQQ) biosynthesis protein C